MIPGSAPISQLCPIISLNCHKFISFPILSTHYGARPKYVPNYIIILNSGHSQLPTEHSHSSLLLLIYNHHLHIVFCKYHLISVTVKMHLPESATYTRIK